MSGIATSTAACYEYQLEVEIEATRERVWKAIFEETEFWWLPDFHMVGEGSVISFDPMPGGRGLIEETPSGGGLLWYSVQMYMPDEFKIYLNGHIAPEWGGPSTSSLKLALVESDSGCILQVTDARHGNIDEAQAQSFESGWQTLFTEGLKSHIEGDDG